MTQEGPPQGVPSEEELREQIRNLTVDDILIQTVVTLINLSGRKLTVEEEKDVEQGKRGIDAARALLPMVPAEHAGPIRDALSQLQMIYVKETGAQPEPEPEPQAEHPSQQSEARSKLWTPPGT